MKLSPFSVLAVACCLLYVTACRREDQQQLTELLDVEDTEWCAQTTDQSYDYNHQISFIDKDSVVFLSHGIARSNGTTNMVNAVYTEQRSTYKVLPQATDASDVIIHVTDQGGVIESLNYMPNTRSTGETATGPFILRKERRYHQGGCKFRQEGYVLW